MSTKTVMSVLGYCGLLPFYATAIWVCSPGASSNHIASTIFIVYGVVILAFLGGTLWGHAITVPAPRKYRRLVASNMVALFAAVAGLMDSDLTASLLLALGQILLLVYERSHADAHGWYLTLRTRLVLAVLPAHALLALGLAL